jgi:ribonucleoside-diphosphate reductase alpha subunit
MKVIARDGSHEDIKFDKIVNRISQAVEYCKLSTDSPIDVAELSIEVIKNIHDNITTRELDEATSRICMAKSIVHPDWAILGSRIAVSNHQKCCNWTFSEGIYKLYNDTYIKGKNKGTHCPIVSKKVYDIVMENPEFWNSVVKSDRDFLIDFFGFKTLEQSYLLHTSDKEIIETIGAMWLRVAIGIWGYDTPNVIKTYDLMSLKMGTHATPTLFNSGTPNGYLASCYLLGMQDSIEGIYDRLKDCALISKRAGGIGIHVSEIRATGSYIGGTGGHTSGIIPMLRVYNDTARFVNQCFVPETVVYTTCGPKQIKDISNGDYVITSDNTYRKVNERFEREVIDEEVVEYSGISFFGTIKCTNVHEIAYYNTGIAIPDNLTNPESAKQFDTNIRNHFKTVTNPEIKFKSACELIDHDYLVFPIPSEPISPIAIGYMEMDTIVRNFRETGLYAEKLTMTSNETIRTFLEDWLVDNIRVEQEPNDRKFEVIGCYVTNRKAADVFRYILLRLGTITPVNKLTADNNTAMEVYRFTIPRSKFFNEIIGKGSSEYDYHYRNGNVIFVPITTLKKTKYTGKVYDLNVESNHNYLTINGLVHNSGKRLGSIAMYLEPWHDDIFAFLEAMKLHGPEEKLVKDLFYALWISDSFMRAVETGGDWYLMCPNESPGLTDVYGEEFEELYNKYISEGNFRRKVKARDIWSRVLEAQQERGMPYLTNKDSVNRKTNQSNLGVIKSSNLCNEIMEYSDPETTAVCNLASIKLDSYIEYIQNTPIFTVYTIPDCKWCDMIKLFMKTFKYSFRQINLDTLEKKNQFLGSSEIRTFPQVFDGTDYIGGFDKMVKIYRPKFDYALFMTTVKQLVRNVDQVIDATLYPTDDSEEGNKSNRPIGLGVQGLSDLFAKMWIPFESEEAIELNKNIFASMYYYALEESCEIAIEKGKYTSFEGSPASKGILQFDMWNIVPDDLRISINQWDLLKEKIKIHGIRNSLLIALMPTASTAQILGSNESFEPIQSCMYVRRTLSGEFIVMNQYLIDSLYKLGLWDETMKQRVMFNRGSIENIKEIPVFLKELHRTVWDISKSHLIKMSADRAPFICQGQSLNHYISDCTPEILHKIHLRSWKLGLKSMSYYIRSRPAANAQNFTIDPELEKKFINENIANEKEVCLNCSS